MKPQAETIPAKPPIAIETPPLVTKSDADPIATPPASVELRRTSISSFLAMILEKPHAVTQDEDIASTVLIITLYCCPDPASALLKDGQYIQRKSVPTMAIVCE